MPDEPGEYRTAATTGDKPAVGYAAAMSEIETILHELEGDDLDVDVLATKVERAAELIGLCRQRIHAAKVQVERVVASLDDEDAHTGDTGDTGAQAPDGSSPQPAAGRGAQAPANRPA